MNKLSAESRKYIKKQINRLDGDAVYWVLTDVVIGCLESQIALSDTLKNNMLFDVDVLINEEIFNCILKD